MSIPTYDDMGKGIKEFFNKNYFINVFKFSAKKTNAFPSVDTAMTANHKLEDSTAAVDYETKYNYQPWGLVTSAKIDTEKIVNLKVEVAEKLVQGLKVVIDSKYNVESAAKTAKLQTQYKLPQGTFEIETQGGDESSLLMGASVVLGYEGFFGGYQVQYDGSEGSFKKNNVALGYSNGNNWTIMGNMDNAEAIQGMTMYKFPNNVEVGVAGQYTSGDEEKTGLTLGLKYNMSPCTSFKAKIDNKKVITMGCEMKVTDAATLTLCAQCDEGKAGKVGAGLEFSG